ncbi:hypothetical protein [Parasphingorhabdus sp.]|jgi:hypothetical protein|uniref:hypothetical protein n=1 Tax=Parasphingorhabdus sp. TaxID=2709688 RepID=UPI00267810ED
MPALNKLSRTEVSAIVSILLFGMTILISAVGPAAAQGSIPPTETASPSVSFFNSGYRA